jgi:polyhydroxyalkanoate synthesis regulator phasin
MWLSAGKISFGASDANIFTKNETTTEIKNSENSLKNLIEEENKEIEEILGKVDNLSEQIDKGVETHYGANDPSSGWTINESGGVNYVENRIGDLWYDTTVNMSYMFVKGDNPDSNTHKDSKIVGYYWRASDVPQSVYDTIDGKSKIYISKPDNSYRTGDLWFIENDSYKNIRFAGGISGITSGTCMVAIAICDGRFSYNDWGKRDKYVSQIEITQATDALSSAITENIEALKTQVAKLFQVSARLLPILKIPVN